MSSSLHLRDLTDTRLWRRLKSGFQNTADQRMAEHLAGNLLIICQEAADRMKAFPSLHPQYTLHDETHLLRVTELMACIIPDEELQSLNPPECALLVLGAYFHDQGMVLEPDEIMELRSDPDFRVFESNWEVEHPNLREIRARLADRNVGERERQRLQQAEHELCGALLTDYIRSQHAERSATFVRQSLAGDKSLGAFRTSLPGLLARLCSSHAMPVSSLSPASGLNYDESIQTYQVNMPYLAVMLRLADILDFDRERTPDALYRCIHFTNEVSLTEWEKHRAIQGWVISPVLVRFTARCKHPIYERAVRHYMDVIDDELAGAHDLLRTFPAAANHCRLAVPPRVDRSRIGPKDDAYIYHELEFSLSRDEIVRLLMLDSLYESKALCVRELLQNSLDALRYRKALFQRDRGLEWADGKVLLRHFLDEYGHEVLECTDNGVGMDQQTIERFLTTVGRSYYRSPEFEQERASFRAAGVDFDPCSRFGIGFMSYFMFGDRFVVETRRDYGPKRGEGDPLIVEINGLGGMLVIRRGRRDQAVGTRVCITGRRKPPAFDEYIDEVRLVAMADGYALACEFPIEAKCDLQEIAGETVIRPEIPMTRTTLEAASVASCLTLRQDFVELDERLRGHVRESFLTDGSGSLVLENAEAKWFLAGSAPLSPYLKKGDETSRPDTSAGQVCADGILVCGMPGRTEEARRMLGYRTQRARVGFGNFLLDVRGELKPPLTAARVPPRWHEEIPEWRRVYDLVDEGYGRLWERVAQRAADANAPETFWQLAALYGVYPPWMRAGAIWSFVKFPLRCDDGTGIWRNAAEMGEIRIDLESERPVRLHSVEGFEIIPTDGILKWRNEACQPACLLADTVVMMSTLALVNGEPRLRIHQPSTPDEPPGAFAYRRFPFTHVKVIPYSGQLSSAFVAELPFQNANREHPLVRIALSSEYLPERTDLQLFARCALTALSEAPTLRELGQGSAPVTRFRRHLGQLYLAVDWSGVAPEARAPYTVWTAEHGMLELTHDMFVHWAEARRVS